MIKTPVVVAGWVVPVVLNSQVPHPGVAVVACPWVPQVAQEV
jgi:hypothetical protein